MLEFITAVIIVIGSIGAVAEGAEGRAAGHTKVERCEARIKSVFSGEVLPAVIEACYDDQMRAEILKCKRSDGACIQDAAGFDE